MSFRHHRYTCELNLNQFQECHPHDYLVKQCIDQQSRSALSSFPQYHLQLLFHSYTVHIKQPVNHKWRVNIMVQFDCTEESMRNLPNNW
ncbi:hypothetical protein T07_2411 [Trichinella nelsoni]|uniref:Uncharacterized protein n=1 Tax=Trichinella nelsoni TaxID=6336 RepID=A0A0V0RC59_9BILA|nr:hypothetical protein T07_2411 [Trichinella nelsoni]